MTKAKCEISTVKMDELPYEIPENWVWVRLPQICEYIKAGGDKPKNITKLKTELNIIPVVANGITDDGIIGYTDVAKAERDTITISARGTIGFSVMRDYKYYPIVRLIVLKPSNLVLPKLLKYIFDNFIEEGSGTSIPQLTVPMIKGKIIPISPLPEQQRIVNQIDSLFEKIDKAEALINEAREGYEKRKEAILAKAFRGELTEKWRDEQDVFISEWQKVLLGEKVTLISGQDISKKYCNEFGKGIPYILGASNLINNTFIAERWIENTKVISNKNDILISVKGTIGKVYLQSEKEINISRQIMAIRNNGDWNNKYLYYFILNEAKRLSNEGNGLIPGIPRSKVLEIKVELPTIREQNEIVQILDELLAKEDKALNLSNHIELIANIKKAILAEAFRGKLGTNKLDEISIVVNN